MYFFGEGKLFSIKLKYENWQCWGCGSGGKFFHFNILMKLFSMEWITLLHLSFHFKILCHTKQRKMFSSQSKHPLCSNEWLNYMVVTRNSRLGNDLLIYFFKIKSSCEREEDVILISFWSIIECESSAVTYGKSTYVLICWECASLLYSLLQLNFYLYAFLCFSIPSKAL